MLYKKSRPQKFGNIHRKIPVLESLYNLEVHILSKLMFTSIQKRICGALSNLVPFLQFKKRKKHAWRSVTSSKVKD